MTAVQRAGQEAGDDAARDLAEDVDPDLVPVAVEDDGRAEGTCWADGTARERRSCAHGIAGLLSLTLVTAHTADGCGSMPNCAYSGFRMLHQGAAPRRGTMRTQSMAHIRRGRR